MNKIISKSHSFRARDQLQTSLIVRFAFQILNAKYQPNQAEMSLQSLKIWLSKPGTHHSCGACSQQIPPSSLLTMLWLISERDLGNPWLAKVNAKSLIRQKSLKGWCQSHSVLDLPAAVVLPRSTGQAVESLPALPAARWTAQGHLHWLPLRGDFTWLGHSTCILPS